MSELNSKTQIILFQNPQKPSKTHFLRRDKLDFWTESVFSLFLDKFIQNLDSARWGLFYPYLGCPSATQICGSHPIWGAHRTTIVAVTPRGVPRYDMFRTDIPLITPLFSEVSPVRGHFSGSWVRIPPSTGSPILLSAQARQSRVEDFWCR